MSVRTGQHPADCDRLTTLHGSLIRRSRGEDAMPFMARVLTCCNATMPEKA